MKNSFSSIHLDYRLEGVKFLIGIAEFYHKVFVCKTYQKRLCYNMLLMRGDATSVFAFFLISMDGMIINMLALIGASLAHVL